MKLQPLPAAVTGQTDVLPSTTDLQPQRRQIRSVELFSGQREVLIEHGGEFYSLRQTSKGKLILTK
jgi:hemin uptake protein HemP